MVGNPSCKLQRNCWGLVGGYQPLSDLPDHLRLTFLQLDFWFQFGNEHRLISVVSARFLFMCRWTPSICAQGNLPLRLHSTHHQTAEGYEQTSEG